jgi:hypothetical protein
LLIELVLQQYKVMLPWRHSTMNWLNCIGPDPNLVMTVRFEILMKIAPECHHFQLALDQQVQRHDQIVD